MPKTFVVGDIHGNAIEFKRALHAAGYQFGDSLIVLGDVIDRGPLSREMVDFLMHLSNCTCLRGNHEAWLLEAAAGDSVNLSLWLGEGGIRCLQSYGVEIRLSLTPQRVYEYSAWMDGRRLVENLLYCDPQQLCEFISASIEPHHLDFMRSLPEQVVEGDFLFRHWIDPGVSSDKIIIVGHEHHIAPWVGTRRIELGLNRNRVAVMDIDSLIIHCSDNGIVNVPQSILFGSCV